MANNDAAVDGPAHSNIFTSKALTRANLNTHQQEMTLAGARNTPVHGWLAESCDRPLRGRAAGKRTWTRLVAKDKLAADIEAAQCLGDRK